MPLSLLRIFALAGTFGTVVLVTLAIAPSALGHAALVESDPEPGERVEVAPQEVRLVFTEPLNRRLSEATMRAVASGRDVPVELEVASGKALVARTHARLPRGAYEVEWRTVSPEDGHRLEGSFSFGVRTRAAGGEQELEQSPLARGGWLRVASRVLLYGALLSFAGALILEATLNRPGIRGWSPTSWTA